MAGEEQGRSERIKAAKRHLGGSEDGSQAGGGEQNQLNQNHGISDINLWSDSLKSLHR
jgi:hypothetical protein